MKYSDAKQYLKEGMTVLFIKSNKCACDWTRKLKLNGVGYLTDERNTHIWNDSDELEILTNSDGSPWVHPAEQVASVLTAQMINRAMESLRANAFYGPSLCDFYTNQPIKKPTFMSSIVRKIKDLTLSADDRILRKHGFENESGKMTEEAEDLMDEELREERWKTRRTELATDLRKVEAEEKAA